MDVVLGTSERSMESGIPGRLKIGRKESPQGRFGREGRSRFPSRPMRLMKPQLQGPAFTQIVPRSMPNFVFFFLKLDPTHKTQV